MTPLQREVYAAGDIEQLRRIAVHLEADGLLAYPTETVYGIGGRVREPVIARVRDLKGRSEERPLLLLLPEPEGWGAKGSPAEGIASLAWTPLARALAAAFWPGPLTIVLADPSGTFPPGVRSEAGGVAVRVSPHPFVRALLQHWPHPLISTSANRAGEPPAMDPDEVEELLGGRPGSERLQVVDAGRLAPSDPSTVVDCTAPRPRVLRHGAVSMASLRQVAPDIR
jgi:L-threonylcarbamoyladenylate synthase